MNKIMYWIENLAGEPGKFKYYLIVAVVANIAAFVLIAIIFTLIKLAGILQ